MISGDITIRVRYAETDRMGLLHHANYLVYFEQGAAPSCYACPWVSPIATSRIRFLPGC